MSLYSCCVFNCKTLKGTKCHNFPQEKSVRESWLKLLKREDLIDLDYEKFKATYRVCTLHFSQKQKFIDYRDRTVLKHNAVPDSRLPKTSDIPQSVSSEKVYQIIDGKVVLSKTIDEQTPLIRRLEAGKNLDNYLKKRTSLLLDSDRFWLNNPKVVLKFTPPKPRKPKIQVLSAQNIPQSKENKTEIIIDEDPEHCQNDESKKNNSSTTDVPSSSKNIVSNEDDVEDISKIKNFIATMLKTTISEKLGKPNNINVKAITIQSPANNNECILLNNYNQIKSLNPGKQVSKLQEVTFNSHKPQGKTVCSEKEENNSKHEIHLLNDGIISEDSFVVIVESSDENELDDDDGKIDNVVIDETSENELDDDDGKRDNGVINETSENELDDDDGKRDNVIYETSENELDDDGKRDNVTNDTSENELDDDGKRDNVTNDTGENELDDDGKRDNVNNETSENEEGTVFENDQEESITEDQSEDDDCNKYSNVNNKKVDQSHQDMECEEEEEECRKEDVDSDAKSKNKYTMEDEDRTMDSIKSEVETIKSEGETIEDVDEIRLFDEDTITGLEEITLEVNKRQQMNDGNNVGLHMDDEDTQESKPLKMISKKKVLKRKRKIRTGLQYMSDEARVYYDIALRLNRKVKKLKYVVSNLQEKLADNFYTTHNSH